MSVKLAANLFKKSDFAHCQKLILAVSGGSDSLALMFLVKDHLKTLLSPPEMIAVTVDHQLREESSAEAENVAKICCIQQIKHVIVQWKGEKPKTNVLEKARVARYDLLFKEAEKHGATLIMTGHTLNDQVETYQMRRSRNVQKNAGALQQEPFENMDKGACVESAVAGIFEKSDALVLERGLSCIPREALLRRKVRLIRPLLGVKRKTLRAYLCFRKTTWIDDPTNEDLKFERVRVRYSISQQKFVSIAKKVNEATLKRRKQAQKIADLILALDISVEYGRCFIGKPAPFLLQHPGFPFVVGLFAVLMGGRPYLLPYQKLVALRQKLCLQYPEKQRFTLAGSVIEYNQNSIVCWRESRNIKEIIIDPGQTLLWDGRYQITNQGINAIKVKSADLVHLKECLDMGIVDLERPHFPSLQSLLMISHNNRIDIPELFYPFPLQHKVIIKRIIAPFDWLLSCEDAALVNVVWPFFNIA
ncbi:tRNA lysidine(34) synthetase TilS [Bartonella sp. A05]|uniref:tRNA lysidine(34) synthetase TilS n=1 Tax=Bartonella sp. A05 TaxID=2967261 RepID=UPI0022A92390|nr:tRNA lysidine(34) synthetase TilS [Bartonella sp. A05]MCZ2203673.1 tRNA lysidine(34) synthetase TilS [Bartonella sp. A05]